MVKVPIWAILYYLRVADLMGTQVFLYKLHAQTMLSDNRLMRSVLRVLGRSSS